MATTLTVSEAKARLSELVDTVQQTEKELVITRNGRPAAVLMSADEFESLKATQEIKKNPALMKEIKKGITQLKKGQRVSFVDVFGHSDQVSKRKN